jgi:hypothetical protein
MLLMILLPLSLQQLCSFHRLHLSRGLAIQILATNASTIL